MVLQNASNNEIVAGVQVKLGSDADGDIYYYSGGALTRLPKGDPGQTLQQGASFPFWGNVSATPTGNAGGDLTGTYPNPTIAANAVTFAKMQTVAQDRLLGRVSSGTGAIEALTQAQARTFLGLGSAAYLTAGTGATNVLQLDSNGLIPTTVIPSFALTSTQVVASQTERLALTNVEIGDVAKQTDNGISYILSALPASTDANWISIGDTTIVASDIVSGTIATARLGSGTASSGTWLRGDQAWSALPYQGLPFTSVVGTSQSMVADNGYLANNAGLVTLTLPTTAALGTIIEVIGIGAGGWRIAQNASQSIVFGNKTSTTGIGGRIDSTFNRDTVMMRCVSANLVWQVVHAVGNLDVV